MTHTQYNLVKFTKLAISALSLKEEDCAYEISVVESNNESMAVNYSLKMILRKFLKTNNIENIDIYTKETAEYKFTIELSTFSVSEMDISKIRKFSNDLLTVERAASDIERLISITFKGEAAQ
tara:strand:+ start:364 stop:732 length:369 start_codon:yes stop_codon:yes gene_type:complete